jgi:hypothetical protein
MSFDEAGGGMAGDLGRKPRDGITDAFSAGFPNPDFVIPV